MLVCGLLRFQRCVDVSLYSYRSTEKSRDGIIDRHWLVCVYTRHTQYSAQYTVESESDDEWSAQEMYTYSRMANRIL